MPTACLSLHFALRTPALRECRDAEPIHSQEDQHGGGK